MSKVQLSRRGFLKGLAATTGAAIGTRIAGGTQWLGEAAAATEIPALCVLFLSGGYNALFSSADSLVGSFGVTSTNIQSLGNGLFVDASTYGTMPAFALQHMATIGVNHGLSDHDAAQTAVWSDGQRSYALQLANSIGGDAAIKAAVLGNLPDGPGPAEGDVTYQTITDMSTTIAALSGSPDPTIPARDIGAAGILSAQGMSTRQLAPNPKSLITLNDGYNASVAVLKKPVVPFNFSDLTTAYGLQAGQTQVSDLPSQFAAAELMITAGANVVMLEDDSGWDSHGDTDGSAVRQMMTQNILPTLNVFLNRMLGATGRNVVVLIMGDFARSLPGSDHQPNLSATVMGKYVKVGTTGRTDANVGLPDGSPAAKQLWAYLAAVLKLDNVPFGANPHDLVL
jgi:hypothetical protein